MTKRHWFTIALASTLVLGCGDDENGSASSSAASSGSTGGGGTTSSSSTGGAGGAGGSGGSGAGGSGGGGSCAAELEEALGPIDMVSMGQVTVLATQGATTTLFVDASAGGSMAQKDNPWIYVSLAGGAKVDVTDETAYASTEWDVALKRPLLRSNSGDGGPGNGGAAFLEGATFAEVTAADAQGASLQPEDWFDAACVVQTDPSGAILTSFSGWYDYDMATMTVSPHPGVFVVRGGDGALYKLAILDYYATEDGGTGMAGGRYKIDVAVLP